MKKVNEELIIRYLDGQLSAEEKKNFEKMLNDSPSLKKVLEKYKAVKDDFSVKEIESVDDTYFNGIVPAFRAKLEKKKKAIPLQRAAYAFTVLVIFTAAFILWRSYTVNGSGQDIYQSITEYLTEDDIDDIADYLSESDLTSNPEEFAVDEIISTDYDLEKIADEISEEESYSIVSGYQINDLYSVANEEEWMEAYQRLINKENL